MSEARVPGATILLVEDDAVLAVTLRDRLRADGHAVWRAEGAAEAEAMADELRPDLIILDLMLPDRHGLVLCADLYRRHKVPIILSSGARREEDAAIGRKLGAVDFVAKPFSADELAARVAAALRRAAAEREAARPGGPPLRLGPLLVDQARRVATLGGEPLPLTPTEYRLLYLLASRPNTMLSTGARAVWGIYDEGIANSLGVHLRRLRRKLNRGPVRPPALIAVRRSGYRLAWELGGTRSPGRRMGRGDTEGGR